MVLYSRVTLWYNTALIPYISFTPFNSLSFVFCSILVDVSSFFFFQAEDGIRDYKVTGVQTCALPILQHRRRRRRAQCARARGGAVRRGSRRASRLSAVGYRTGARACRGDAGAPRGPGARGRRHRLRRRAPLARGAQGAAARRGAQAVRGAFLDEMADASRERMRAAKQTRSEAALEAAARQSPAPPPLRLDRSGFDLIAEVKLRSPGSGRLGPRAEDVAARVTAYARAGAAAVSVINEPSRFDGSLEHLARAAPALAPHAGPALPEGVLGDP